LRFDDAHDLEAPNCLFPRSIKRDPDPDGYAYGYTGSHVLSALALKLNRPEAHRPESWHTYHAQTFNR
jgi:hypothetical protein